LSSYVAKSVGFQKIMHVLALNFMLPEFLLITAYLVVGIYTDECTSSRTIDSKNLNHSNVRFTKEEKYAVGSMALQLLVMVAHIITDRLSGEGHVSKCITGIFLSMISLTMFINLIYPNVQAENVVNIRESIKTLYCILYDRDQPSRIELPLWSKKTDSGHPSATIQKDTQKEATDVQTGKNKSQASASSSPDRYVTTSLWRSPKTTVQQDLQATRDALRQCKKHSAFITSDSESDIDHDHFIDLAGGITLSTTEVEDGWSVVSA
jgi:hypothetical protein